MTATVFYDNVNEIALISNTFLNSSQVAADPATISCIITDPSGTSVTHTFGGASPADIVRVSTGKYTLSVPCAPAIAGVDGLWQFEWVGTGAVSDVQPGTWRVLPANVATWYIGLEEFRDRLGITDSADDSQAQIAIQTVCGWINQYCVVPETPVLTADLRWVPAGSLVIGDSLVGVDEYPVGNRYPKRHFRQAQVCAVPRRAARCVRLTLSDGREVTSAAEHMWLARTSRCRTYAWVPAAFIQPGDEIAAPLRSWDEETGFEAGWLSGVIDGEGCLHKTGTHLPHVDVAQNAGVVFDGITAWLDMAKLPYTVNANGRGNCLKVEVFERWATMELLGRLRPRRLMPRSAETWEGGLVMRKGENAVRVTAAEDAGTREVVSLGTSTGTYIANGLISHNCGQHFNRITEARTFVPYDIYKLNIDPLVSVTSLAVDRDGDGVFEEPWTLNTDYQLRIGPASYNLNATGILRPYRQVVVVQAGKLFPFVYPFAHFDRVQVTGTWGWFAVPAEVAQATFLLAADLFKMKDAPFGVAGVTDYGVTRIQANPWLIELLRPYKNTKRAVGV